MAAAAGWSPELARELRPLLEIQDGFLSAGSHMVCVRFEAGSDESGHCTAGLAARGMIDVWDRKAANLPGHTAALSNM